MSIWIQKTTLIPIITGFLIITSACARIEATDDRTPLPITVKNSITVRNSPVFSISDDGRYIAYAADTDDKNGRELHLLDLKNNQETVLTGTQDGEMPFFSPEANRIGFFVDEKLKTFSRETGQVTTLCETPSPAGGVWRNDGTIFYASDAAIWQISANGGVPGQITRPEEGEVDRWPAILPVKDLILFNRAKPGVPGSSILIGHTDTGQYWPLLEQGSSPRYVTSGHLLYSEGAALKTVALDVSGKTIQGDPQAIMNGVLESPATGVAQYGVAADGSIVYVPGGIFGQARRIVLLDQQGNEHDAGLPPARYSYVRVSPDGQKLAIQIDDEKENIWLYDRRSKTSTLLIEDGAFPVWTPDGKWITFSSARAGVPGIFKVSVEDRNKIEQVSIGEYSRNHSFDWSADGKTLAYTEMNPDTGMDIYLQDEQGSKPWLVTKAEECCPVFSPDQKMLAYVSDKSGRPEVYVLHVTDYDTEMTYGTDDSGNAVINVPVAIDDNRGAAVKVSIEGGREPLWMRDKNTLFFWSDRQLISSEILNVNNSIKAFPNPLLRGIFVSSTSTWRTRFDYIPEQGQFILIKRGPEEMGINTLARFRFNPTDAR